MTGYLTVHNLACCAMSTNAANHCCCQWLCMFSGLPFKIRNESPLVIPCLLWILLHQPDQDFLPDPEIQTELNLFSNYIHSMKTIFWADIQYRGIALLWLQNMMVCLKHKQQAIYSTIYLANPSATSSNFYMYNIRYFHAIIKNTIKAHLVIE